MIRNLVIALITIVSFTWSCGNKNELTISGRIENVGNVKKVLLYEGDTVVDSAFLNESNEFKFRRVAPDPNFFTLEVGERNFLLIGENGDDIRLTTNYADTTQAYSIDGSEDSRKIQEVNRLTVKYGKVFQEMQSQYAAAVAKSPAKQDSIYTSIMPRFQKNMDEYSAEVLKFAKANNDNLAGFFAAGTIDQNAYELELIKFSEEIGPKFPRNKAVQAFVTRMKEKKTVSVGQMAPDFGLPDPTGRTVNVSDYKGKYLLLDFWASWCGPCRDENPNIVRQYKAFKDKGFDVLGVSLDDNRGDWLRAIQYDGLTWAHVSDLKRWDSKGATLYKVDAIPASFIIDPQGKIVAKNLRGEELQKFLSKVLN